MPKQIIVDTNATENKKFSTSLLFIIFKYIAFVGFTVVSMLLSVNMFFRLSTHTLERTLLVITALTLEFFKVYSIVKGNTLWQLRLRIQAFRAFVMYTVLALLSITASYGFTTTVINRGIQLRNTSTIKLQIDANQQAQDSIRSSIADIESRIAISTERLKALPIDFVTAARTLTDSIAKAEAAKTELQAKLESKVLEQTQLRIQEVDMQASSTTTASMFALMAQGFQWLKPGLTEMQLMLFILLLISVLLELGIISTSPAIPIDPKHLKHFLDDASQHRAAEIIEIIQGRKKEEDSKHLSFVGRFLQKLLKLKEEIHGILHPMEAIRNLEAITQAPATPSISSSGFGSQRKQHTHLPGTFATKSVPLRKPAAPTSPISTITDKSENTLSSLPEPTLVVDKSSIEEEKKEEQNTPKVSFIDNDNSTSTETVKESEVTVMLDSKKEKVVDLPHLPPTPAPQPVAESKTYRFGKTTEAVKGMFINFVNKLFETSMKPGMLGDPTIAAGAAGIPTGLATTFINRLIELKGSAGIPLVERKDNELRPNYTREYIINYSTAEPAKDRIR